MPHKSQSPTKFVVAALLIVGVVTWLAVSAGKQSKFYYVTIGELQTMGDQAYARNLRVAGNVQTGSIKQVGTNATFTLLEQGKTLLVSYQGTEPPPDAFKDDAQALAIGRYGRDGVFHASQLQAKCASKYAPAAKPGAAPTGNTAPMGTTASLKQ